MWQTPYLNSLVGVKITRLNKGCSDVTRPHKLHKLAIDFRSLCSPVDGWRPWPRMRCACQVFLKDGGSEIHVIETEGFEDSVHLKTPDRADDLIAPGVELQWRQ